MLLRRIRRMGQNVSHPDNAGTVGLSQTRCYPTACIRDTGGIFVSAVGVVLLCVLIVVSSCLHAPAPFIAVGEDRERQLCIVRVEDASIDHRFAPVSHWWERRNSSPMCARQSRTLSRGPLTRSHTSTTQPHRSHEIGRLMDSPPSPR